MKQKDFIQYNPWEEFIHDFPKHYQVLNIQSFVIYLLLVLIKKSTISPLNLITYFRKKGFQKIQDGKEILHKECFSSTSFSLEELTINDICLHIKFALKTDDY